MNILIDNVSTKNKGSELMLYAVLQEVERKYPNATVWLPKFSIPEGVPYIKTTMNCKQRKISIIARIFKKVKGDAVLRRIFHIPYSYTTYKYPIKKLDLILDAGGFQFSDQFYYPGLYMPMRDNYYKTMKKQNTKIIFLPQAFGPFETKDGKEQTQLLKKYADCIIAREEISYNHLANAGLDKKKMLLYPDFTALVDGVFSDRFKDIKNGIAIIPNLRMIDKGVISRKDYIDIVVKVITICKTSKRTIFFLNDEGKGDFMLCEDINNNLFEKLPIVSNLNALEVKGIIAQCYFIFSSRFHGIVSALNSGVPCLATSWSHKYKMLFKDYNMEGCAFDPNNSDFFYNKLKEFLNEDYNNIIRNKLITKAEEIKIANREMWQKVWSV